MTPILLATSAPAEVFRAEGVSGSVTARASDEFGIRIGSGAGLHPGGDITIRVTYTNPFRYSLLVDSQQLSVTSPSRSCPPTNLDLAPARTVLTKPLVVPARRARSVEIVLSMRAGAPDACQGVRFATSIQAQGRRA